MVLQQVLCKAKGSYLPEKLLIWDDLWQEDALYGFPWEGQLENPWHLGCVHSWFRCLMGTLFYNRGFDLPISSPLESKNSKHKWIYSFKAERLWAQTGFHTAYRNCTQRVWCVTCSATVHTVSTGSINWRLFIRIQRQDVSVRTLFNTSSSEYVLSDDPSVYTVNSIPINPIRLHRKGRVSD